MNEPQTMDLFGEDDPKEKEQNKHEEVIPTVVVGTSSKKQKKSKKQKNVISSRRKGPKKSDKAMRTISEVASLLGVEQHVLRFWETKFHQIKPMKRGGARRYYRPRDVEIVSRIHHYLHIEGYTIKGLQRLLKKQSLDEFLSGKASPVQIASKETPETSQQGEGMDKKMLKDILGNLKIIREELLS